MTGRRKEAFSPMLAASLVRPRDSQEEVDHIKSCLLFPVLATPKIDGIRVTTLDLPAGPDARCTAVCRSLKSLPNDATRRWVEKHCTPGLDGEMVTYPPTDLFQDVMLHPHKFHDVQSALMSFSGTPNFRFHVFDTGFLGKDGWRVPYVERVEMLKNIALPEYCVKVLPTKIHDLKSLESFMADCIQQGHEGMCFRTLQSPYKHGRSTLSQQWLIKWKLFATSEATVVGFEERMHNANEATRNELGYQERSSHQSNMVPCGDLGALVVTLDKKILFKVGTGFNAAQRQELWAARESLVGRIVTFKHQSHGEKDVPRIPVFVGIRDARDMSA